MCPGVWPGGAQWLRLFAQPLVVLCAGHAQDPVFAPKPLLLLLALCKWHLGFRLYLFLAVLGLRCCPGASLGCSKRGLLFLAVCGLPLPLAGIKGNVKPVGDYVETSRWKEGCREVWSLGSHGYCVCVCVHACVYEIWDPKAFV